MTKDGVQWRLTIFREENTGALHSYRNLMNYSVAKDFTLSGQHSTEVAFKLLNQPSQVPIPALIDIYAINNDMLSITLPHSSVKDLFCAH